MKTSKHAIGILALVLIPMQQLLGQTESYTGPIIDMHIHAFDENSGFNGFLAKDMSMAMDGKTYTAVASMEELRTATFAKFKEHNIVKAVVSQGALWHEYAPQAAIIGNNQHRTIEELRQKYAEGKLEALAEVAPNYDGILPTDPRMAPYFDLAEELGIPMGYHLMPGGPPGGAYFAYPETRASQAKPLQMEEILLARPNMRIYIMHAGWPFLEDMKALMYAHPQVYVEVGAINWILTRAEFHHFLKGLVDAGFGKRIMFGTDQMVWVETITDGIEAINSAEFLTKDQKADIFYNNAARFLELSEEEVKRHQSVITEQTTN